MNSLLENTVAFHFLRPGWLFMLPVLIGLFFWLKQQQGYRTGFEQLISSHLLQHIRVGYATDHRLPYYGLVVIWVATTLVLAGPAWKQLPQQLHESESALVIILDLSPSMNAEDNKPSRIVRARLKIQDLLSQRKDGLTALVVYAGESHIVTPLTDDTRTIVNLLPTLQPGLLPIPGSNIEMAAAMSRQLVLDSGLNQASFFLVTDGIDPAATETLETIIGNDIELFILGIGTKKGAPIPASDGILKDDDDQPIIAQRNDDEIRAIAQATGGTYLPLQADSSDIEFITARLNQPKHQTRELERYLDQWYESGPTFLLLILPLAAMAFRRGYLLSLTMILLPLITPQPASAWSINDLWLTPDQQGEKAFHQHNFSDAEKHFNNPQWRGSAAYRNQNYAAAAEAFARGDTATDHYNRGNALAQQGRIDDAIKAYNDALQRQPDLTDAKENLQLLEQLKQQQEQPKNNQNTEEPSESHRMPEPSKNNHAQAGSGNQQSSSETHQQQSTQREEPKQQHAKNPKRPEGNEEKSESTGTTNRPLNRPPQENALAQLNEEEKQALEQWLRKIPDDPSGLLRRKFEYEFQKRRQAYQQGQWQLPKNNAHKRY